MTEDSRKLVIPYRLPNSDWEIFPIHLDQELGHYDIAFLLMPGIVVPPSPTGNAIASITAALANGMRFKSIVFSFMPQDLKQSLQSVGEYSVAYYSKKLQESRWDRSALLGKIKNRLMTPMNVSWRQYALAAAEACLQLGVKCLVIEDVADFGWAVRKLRKAGISVILHQHAFTQRNYNAYLWRRIERNLDKIIFVSERTRKMTESRFGKYNIPASVIYNGVDLKLYDPEKCKSASMTLRENLNIDARATMLTFVGRLNRSKGILETLKAFIAMNLRDLHFMIIGSTSLMADKDFIDELNALILKAKSSGLHVCFFENIPQAELPQYYQISDYIIVPSNNYYEGLPKVVTEALAMGVPVIASDRGGIWELLTPGQNGWKINDPITPENIRSAIEKAMSFNLIPHVDKINDNSIRGVVDQNRMIRSFEAELSQVMNGSR